jgi:hypothetical protein
MMHEFVANPGCRARHCHVSDSRPWPRSAAFRCRTEHLASRAANEDGSTEPDLAGKIRDISQTHKTSMLDRLRPVP